LIFVGCAVIAIAFYAVAQNKPAAQDSERKITENEVPKAALDALKKAAGNNKFTEFAEEIEHGHKFYEGSWAGPTGNVDAVVTEAGDLVVLEEVVPADKIPGAVAADAKKQAGQAPFTVEKKTMVLYEIHYKKDGKSQELVLTPDARKFDEDAATGEPKGAKDEDDEKDEDGGK
jgi:hypothetical protein